MIDGLLGLGMLAGALASSSGVTPRGWKFQSHAGTSEIVKGGAYLPIREKVRGNLSIAARPSSDYPGHPYEARFFAFGGKSYVLGRYRTQRAAVEGVDAMLRNGIDRGWLS